ncbi:hypothetical protein EU244_030685 [Rhodococcus qingshengii]|uniref:hypothetical protein n=1 Tax=Rhodococcus qingshengii TaxID=334542 RepID=UPI0010A5F702|nr:hypothetical protein [Rhodococcus qingshengii]THJ65726.1 hypothetical protein EU244_29025 [Rhodococcus qingshengii]
MADLDLMAVSMMSVLSEFVAIAVRVARTPPRPVNGKTRFFEHKRVHRAGRFNVDESNCATKSSSWIQCDAPCLWE